MSDTPPPHIIVIVHVTDRIHHAGELQQVLTEYGCSIKTRLGLHEVDKAHCAPSGLIVLEMFGDPGPIADMITKLEAITGLDVRRLDFPH